MDKWFVVMFIVCSIGCEDPDTTPEGTVVQVSDVHGCQTFRVRAHHSYEGYIYYTRCGKETVQHREVCHTEQQGKTRVTQCVQEPQVTEEDDRDF